MQNTIRIENTELQPISAFVEFYHLDPSLDHSEVHPTNEYGEVEVPDCFLDGKFNCFVMPVDGHWNTQFSSVAREQPLRCKKMFEGFPLDWWSSLVGLDDTGDNIQSVKIGIIDTGFMPMQDNENIRVYDIEGKPISKQPENFDPHGYAVTKIINESTNRNKGAEIILIDVSDATVKGFPSNVEIVAKAITILSLDFEVDIINLSAGFYFSDCHGTAKRSRELLDIPIGLAVENGCVVVAAVGNARSDIVAYPAASENVIGVGSIGLSGLAPEGTLCAKSEAAALRDQGCIGNTSCGARVYADVETSHGVGLDAVAPGIGITLAHADGSVVEQYGTSFAAPIVTSILALELEDIKRYEKADCSDYYQIIKNKLQEISHNLNIQYSRQGFGMPSRRKMK